MRNHLKFVSVTLLFFAQALLGQVTVSKEREETTRALRDCVFALEMPAYPSLARAARITGHGSASVILNADGIPEVTTAGLHPLLAAEVERSIRHSDLAKCGASKLTFEYDFVIEGGETVQGVNTVVMLGGNHFMIKVTPPVPTQ